MNINDVYKELTSKIIGQDDPIKQILSTIWKQYNNNDRPTNYNILININYKNTSCTFFLDVVCCKKGF